MHEFLKSLAIQRRVIGALIMRETYTRFGRENLGFAWIFGEFLDIRAAGHGDVAVCPRRV